MVNHQFSPLFNLFPGIELSLKSKFWWPWTPKAQIDMLGKNCQKLTYLPNLPTWGKGTNHVQKKIRSYASFVLEVRYLYPFYSKNICHLGYPSYLSSKLGPLESKVRSFLPQVGENFGLTNLHAGKKWVDGDSFIFIPSRHIHLGARPNQP